MRRPSSRLLIPAALLGAALPLGVLLLTPTASAATAADPPAPAARRPLPEIIDDYVRAGLAANLGLRNATLDVERSQAALDAARARFLPEIGFDARYTRAEGGRVIELPVAALLNPVHSTLNELLAASGRPAGFPQIEDRGFNLIREQEQDTRLTLRQPLYAPAIPAAVRAQRALLEGSEYARIAFARRLKRDITVAYLGWLQASQTVAIVDSSHELLAENLRINESLFHNGRITEDQVLRARAELLAVEQQSREARNSRSLTRSYLNFLLNRALDTALEPAELGNEIERTTYDLAQLRANALDNRPELAQLERLAAASRAQAELARAARRPTLSLGADAGTQGEHYEFGRGRNFATISLMLNWTLFDGGARRAEQRVAEAGVRQARIRQDELASQVQLEVQQALDRLETSADSLRTAEARAAAARAGLRIAGRKRDEGAINQVEFIDARNTLTSAELNLNLIRFQLLGHQAELDYATAAGSLPAEPGVPQL
ncbi:MAG: TolC family protein [Sinobacteraceae bacterium]|nr:TolC family protein [Nevskiaceae bacterium]MCP5338684.1 TolC family protein [Nevskiaceae bacterium]MCP5473005.1 TolC family protein [Nevskiaceae bacterium]